MRLPPAQYGKNAVIVLSLLAAGFFAAWLRFRPHLGYGGTYTDGARHYEELAEERLRYALWDRAEPLSGPVNTSAREAHPALSPDGRWLVFEVGEVGLNADLWIARVVDGVPQEAEPLSGLNTAADELAPAFAEGQLYFATNRPGTLGGLDLWRAPFAEGLVGEAESLGPAINTRAHDRDPAPFGPGGTLVFASDRRADKRSGYDLYLAAPQSNESYRVERLEALSTYFDEREPAFAADGRSLVFASDRLDSVGGFDLYRSLWDRGQWLPAEPLQGLNSADDERGPFPSRDGFSLLFSRESPSRGADIFQARSIELFRQPGRPVGLWDLLILAALLVLALLAWLARRWESLEILYKCFLISILVHLALLWWFRDIHPESEVAVLQTSENLFHVRLARSPAAELDGARARSGQLAAERSDQAPSASPARHEGQLPEQRAGTAPARQLARAEAPGGAAPAREASEANPAAPSSAPARQELRVESGFFERSAAPVPEVLLAVAGAAAQRNAELTAPAIPGRAQAERSAQSPPGSAPPSRPLERGERAAPEAPLAAQGLAVAVPGREPVRGGDPPTGLAQPSEAQALRSAAAPALGLGARELEAAPRGSDSPLPTRDGVVATAGDSRPASAPARPLAAAGEGLEPPAAPSPRRASADVGPRGEERAPPGMALAEAHEPSVWEAGAATRAEGPSELSLPAAALDSSPGARAEAGPPGRFDAPRREVAARPTPSSEGPARLDGPPVPTPARDPLASGPTPTAASPDAPWVRIDRGPASSSPPSGSSAGAAELPLVAAALGSRGTAQPSAPPSRNFTVERDRAPVDPSAPRPLAAPAAEAPANPRPDRSAAAPPSSHPSLPAVALNELPAAEADLAGEGRAETGAALALVARELVGGGAPAANAPRRWSASPADAAARPPLRGLAAAPAPAAPGAPLAPQTFEHTPYRTRFGPAKEQALREHGGSAETEAAVAAGLSYLAGIQHRRGHWGSREHWDDKYGRTHVGKSGLCLLAFLGAGHTHRSRTQYSDNAARAIAALLGTQDPRTGHFGDTSAYSHAVVTYALAECYALTADKELVEPLERAVGWILANQNERRSDPARFGGWSYYYADGHSFDSWPRTSITAWQVMALESARLGGLEVSEEAFDDAREFLWNAWDSRRGWFRYNHKPDRLRSNWPTLPASTPAAVFALSLLGEDAAGSAFERARSYIQERAPRDYRAPSDDAFVRRAQGNLYFWYYASMALFRAGGDDWRRWNLAMQEALLPAQEENGSWEPISVYAEYAGDDDRDRSYTTAMCVLSLEIYYRYFTPLLEVR